VSKRTERRWRWRQWWRQRRRQRAAAGSSSSRSRSRKSQSQSQSQRAPSASEPSLRCCLPLSLSVRSVDRRGGGEGRCHPSSFFAAVEFLSCFVAVAIVFVVVVVIVSGGGRQSYNNRTRTNAPPTSTHQPAMLERLEVHGRRCTKKAPPARVTVL